ncbi:SMC-Scp complex subunit ScpB [Algihabitans albus]|uniref:SMC-Scp complex subunit ScpB n=1 Tax=Algihabitans albus TaxID=2164067 RepID=UPI000E5D2C30|nr:SMC-Scp complex subunit ScpB [Algihabitans albus]
MSEVRFQQIRLLEALLFAAAEPLGEKELARHFADDVDLARMLEELAGLYEARGVNLRQIGDKWAFRTAADLAPRMRIESETRRKLSRAAIETLAVVAYHQPVTRAEIEEIRSVALSKGTLDTLLEAGWIKPRGRRRTPGKPVTWGTTDAFLDHFGLDAVTSLPGLEELKAAGLLDARPAMTALGARGELPPAGPGLDDERDDDAENEDELLEDQDLGTDEALVAEFGDLPPSEADRPEADDSDDEAESEDADAGDPADLDEQAAADEDAAVHEDIDDEENADAGRSG